MRLLRNFIFLLLACGSLQAAAQEAAAADSLKAVLAKTTAKEELVELLDELSRVQMNINPVEAEETGNRLISVAEQSRDRKLMFKAYLSNGTRCSYLGGQKSWLEKSIGFYNQALQLARENRMQEETGVAQLHLTRVFLMGGEKDKALNAVTQANSVVATLKNDSLLAEVNNSFGQVFYSRNENILALRNYLIALRIAEDIRNTALIRNCYLYLSEFYGSIEEYDKAIDYMADAYALLDKTKEKNAAYQKVIYINSIGNLYAQKKSYSIAIGYFERSIRMADSLRFSTLKIPGYVSLLNQYLRIDEPQKALDFLNSATGEELKKYLGTFGMEYVIDQAYGVVYTGTGLYDSARVRLQEAMPFFVHNANTANKISFIAQYANLMRKSGNTPEAIRYYQQVKDLGEATGMLEYAEKASKYLDTLFRKSGDISMANFYNAIYYQYKDSIATLKRAKEIVQEESDDLLARTQKAEQEEAAQQRQRNNIQYLAIVIGIISLFVALVVLGMFKVSRGVIKAIGFFVFLMFFEFIFLLFKKQIYAYTRGEPWKDLAFMIALAAVLVPLHHWLEHKVLHYLTSHNRLTSAGSQLREKIFGKAGEG